MATPTRTEARLKRQATADSAEKAEKKRKINVTANMRNVDPLTHKRSLVQQRIVEVKEDLPHRYGWKWYRWGRAFYESRNRINLLCSGNQVSKSSSLIRKFIEWAGNKKLWPSLWETQPRQFWYFYPSLEVATIEFEKKWVPEFMPRGAMKNHDTYGWDAEYSGSEISAIHFRSGVTVYFKTYAQRLINLQTSTVHMIGCDEEMPPDYADEVLSRLAATRGYFHMVFTATKGYPLWYRAMECQGKSEEVFKDAFKLCISLYDCQVYEDGTPGHWSLERIKEREASCTSPQEVQRRVYGRFVRDDGRKYAAFDPNRNMASPTPIPTDWKYYGGVDIGSGGSKARSSGAVIFVVVDPLFTKGRVFKSWRGDGVETSAGDILEKYRQLRGKDVITQACYDYQSREFALMAHRSGEPFQPADKNRSGGEQTLNTLFQAGALTIDDAYDNQKLVTELMSIPSGDKVRSYQDDLSDALRYTVQLIPWDFSKIVPNSRQDPTAETDEVPRMLTDKEYLAWEIEQRRGEFKPKQSGDWGEYFEELDMWNEAYGS